MSKHGILSGLLVIDLTTNIAGPFTTHILSSLGASVLKVERVAGGDDARMMFPTFGDKSAYFSLLNSSKKSIALDIRTPEGSAILRRLISRADVLVENFRPQVSRRLGLSWTEVKKMNEGIIHVSISAYGQRGPERDRSGYDALLQARTGIMSVTGNAGEPPVRVGVSILDLSAGLWAALGTLGALIEKRETGRGMRVTTSLFEGGIWFFGYHLAYRQLTGSKPVPRGTSHSAFSPYGAFATKDDSIYIGISNDRQFTRLAEAILRPELIADRRFRRNSERVENREELRETLESTLRKKSTGYWERRFVRHEIPFSRIQDVDQVLSDPQAAAISLFYEATLDGTRAKLPRLPLNLTFDTDVFQSAAVPRLGQHTREILASLGYTDPQIRTYEKADILKT